MSSQVFSIDPTPNETNQKRVVEAEIKLGAPKDWQLPHIDTEPILQAAGQVLLTGIGLGVLAVRGARRALKAAYNAGSQAAQEDGTLAHAIHEMAHGKSVSKDAEPVLRTHVPMLPINDYDELTIEQLTTRLASLNSDALRVVRDYELAHARRTTVLEAISRYLESA